jgi:zinc/manganese transport system permease protein
MADPTGILAPFLEFAFMRRAAAAAVIVALAAAPVGVFLMLRRMTLMGDAIAHGVLPGLALAFLWAGLSSWAMAVGGLVSGLVVAALAGLIARLTSQREDASLAALYLMALATGVLLLSMGGAQIDLAHILFGSALGVDEAGLAAVAVAAAVCFALLALIWPALVLDTVDPEFLKGVSAWGGAAHAGFLTLVVLVLVMGFQAVGTLMSVGLMVLPAAAARFWTDRLAVMIALAMGFGVVAALAGLIASYYLGGPTGPCIILVAGVMYLISVVAGPADGLLARARPRSHLSG